MGALLLGASYIGPKDTSPPRASQGDRYALLLLGNDPLETPAPRTPAAGLPASSGADPPTPRRQDLAQDVPGPPAPSAAAPARVPIHAAEPDPSGLLLLQVTLDGLQLTDGMAAYGYGDDPLLPAGELTRLLELDVDVSPGEGRIVGRLGQARRSLVVDLATGMARIGPEEEALRSEDVAVTQTEIYLRASVLQRLLPVRLEVSARALTMKITATELLPIQSRIARQRRASQAGFEANTSRALQVKTPYKLFTPPGVDLALGVGDETARPRHPTRYDIRLAGDLAYAGLQAYLGSDQFGRAASARVTLERQSAAGNLLGPLHARDLAAGDVFSPSLTIGPRSIAGRGIAISNIPLDQAYATNRIDLRGELPLGDDVELYVNDVLRGSQNTGVQGRYEFLDVQLTRGVNVVRIVTYGPHGETKEEIRVINASGGLLRPGEATYEFGAVAENEPIFRLRADGQGSPDESIGRPRIVANLNYGLTQSLTLTTGASTYADRRGQERSLYDVGLRTSLLGFASQFDVATDSRGGEAASVGVAGRVLGANTVFRHTEYRGGLLDETNAEADLDRPLARRTDLTVDRNIKLGGRILPLSLEVLQDVYADGGRNLLGTARGSASYGPVLYSAGLQYNRTISPTGFTDESLRGLLEVSTYRNYQWQVRAGLNYQISPGFEPDVFNITIDRALSRTWSLRFAANRALTTPRATDFLASSITRTRWGDLAFTGEYNTTDRGWTLGAQLNVGLGYNPREKHYEVTRPGPGSAGSVLFHAFVDENGDGHYQPGEKNVANVILEGGERPVRTAADGQAYVTGFGGALASRLQVNLAEVENQAVKAPPATVEFYARPGSVTEIEYPLQPTGEVLVRINLRRPDGQLIGLSATRLRLVDGKGRAFEAVTEFDGSADFQDLPGGSYRLELDPEQAARLRMRLTQPVNIAIKADGGLNSDVKAEVRFEPHAEAAP